MSSKDLILYGGGALLVGATLFLVYKLLCKKGSPEKPKSQVMSKIEDFYSTHDDSTNIKY